MIAFLSGRVVGKIEDKIILRLPSGVGYILNVAPFRNYMVNENLEIFVYETFSKDAKSELYGFDTLEDRKWLEKLTKVSGLDPNQQPI
jgi:Holliday junction resolvasome RuvABC DNA-binding subunit